MVLFALVNPDTPGKLTAHAYSYEHLELAERSLAEEREMGVPDELESSSAAGRVASCSR